MDLVVDASVAFKWLIAEEGSETALALRIEHNVGAPDLLLMEWRNALLTKVRRGKLSVEQARTLERKIDSVALEIVPSGPFLRDAFLTALELGEPIYDCVYLAAAQAIDCRLATADERFATKVARSAVGPERILLLRPGP